MVDATSIVESLCAIITEVLFFVIFFVALFIKSSEYESIYDVASSRISMSGFLIKTLINAINCFCPAERVLPLS